jgi:hypothetical protein
LLSAIKGSATESGYCSKQAANGETHEHTFQGAKSSALESGYCSKQAANGATHELMLLEVESLASDSDRAHYIPRKSYHSSPQATNHKSTISAGVHLACAKKRQRSDSRAFDGLRSGSQWSKNGPRASLGSSPLLEAFSQLMQSWFTSLI